MLIALTWRCKVVFHIPIGRIGKALEWIGKFTPSRGIEVEIVRLRLSGLEGLF